jgi:tight adherence protein B
MASIFYAFIILIFVAVVLAFEGLYLWWNSRHGASARRIESRIRALSAGDPVQQEHSTILKRRTLRDANAFEKLVMSVPQLRPLDSLIQQSGLHWSVARLVGMSCAIPLVVFAATLFTRAPLALSAAGSLVMGAMPYLYVTYVRSKRLDKLQRQLPDAADTISRALRAGHSFPSAIGIVSTEFAEPTAGEFRITFEEINYGVPLNEALSNLVKRVPIRDLPYFVIAVLIQRETGGNLAEVLDGIASLIRERYKLFDKVRVLAAEGKMSAWVLGLLPFVTAIAIRALNPKFLAVLWEDPAGLKLVGVLAVMMVSGIFWMRHIIRIRV